jgi:hypothetical protein
LTFISLKYTVTMQIKLQRTALQSPKNITT